MGKSKKTSSPKVPVADHSSLTKAQQIMMADGLPTALIIPQQERVAWWDQHPPKPYRFEDDADPKIIARKLMEETLHQQQVLVRNNRFANLKAKKAREEFDTTGMRWDARRAKFVPDYYSQEYIDMPKWTITPYDANDAVIQRGVTSIAEGSGEVVVYAKMGAAFHRCATGTVKKIVVTNGGSEIIRQWDENSSAPLPKPTVTEKPDKVDVKKAKAKGAKRAAKADGKKSKGEAIPRGHGVIATVLETLGNSGKKGATVTEMLAVLIKAFPDRDPEAMTKTIRIQMSRNEATKDKDEKRGIVYYAKSAK